MPKVFIAYRRQDSETMTGRIAERLRDDLGRDNVFRDVGSIEAARKFTSVIQKEIEGSDFFLAVIGPHWLSARHPDSGQRRLDDPEDHLRREIEQALEREMPIIPVLIKDAALPREDDLPQSLRSLRDWETRRVRDDPDFDRDMDRLLRGIRGSRWWPPKPAWIWAFVGSIVVLGLLVALGVIWQASRQPALPDLEVRSIHVTPRPAREGERVSFRAELVNSGTADLRRRFNVAWILDDTERFGYGAHIHNLGRGATSTGNVRWHLESAPAGRHKVTYIADVDDAVPELSEQNNQSSIEFNVLPEGPAEGIP